MKLYFFECESADGWVRFLDKTVRLSQERLSDEELIGEVMLTEAEVQVLATLSEEETKKELFAKLGINDLNDYPGLPKGPYYHVDKAVFDFLRRSA